MLNNIIIYVYSGNDEGVEINYSLTQNVCYIHRIYRQLLWTVWIQIFITSITYIWWPVVLLYVYNTLPYSQNSQSKSLLVLQWWHGFRLYYTILVNSSTSGIIFVITIYVILENKLHTNIVNLLSHLHSSSSSSSSL